MNQFFIPALYRKSVKSGVLGLLIWFLVLGGVFSLALLLFPKIATSGMSQTLADVMQAFPKELLDEFHLDKIPDFRDYVFYFSLCAQGLLILGGLYASYLGAVSLVRLQSDHSVVLVYSQPVGRAGIVTSQFCAGATLLVCFYTGLFALAFYTSAGFVDRLGEFAGRLALLMLAQLLVGLIYYSVGFLFSAFLSHRAQSPAMALGLLLTTLLFGIMGGAMDGLEWMEYAAPYRYFSVNGLLSGEGIPAPLPLICAALVLLSVSLSAIHFARKELNT
jgi:ABC-2 type transport system permease protein